LSRTQGRRGFTLLEVTIVVLCLALMATIIVPHVGGAARNAREAVLRADLYRLRLAIETFRAHVGGQPRRLTDLLRISPPSRACLPPDGRLITVLPGTYHGPYLTTPDGGLPVDPVTRARDWVYDRGTGHVRSAATGLGSDGTYYGTW